MSTNLVADEGRKGRTFVIVFDDIHLSAFTAQRAKAAIASFVRTGTREGDRVTLTATGSGAFWSARMGAGRDALVEAVKRFTGRYVPDPSRDYVSDYEAMRIRNFHDTMILNRVQRRFEAAGVQTLLTQQGQHVQNMMAVEDPYVTSRATEVYYTATTRNRVTLGALQRSLDALVDQKGRKSLVLLSEGFIYDHQLPEFKRLIDASRRANTAMYFVNSRGLEGLPLTMTAEFGGPLPPEDIGSAFTASLEDTEGSESLAADSGGFTVRNTNDLAAGLERIGEETRAYYLVGYNPKNTARDGAFRKIEVRVVGRKGTRVRARKGYYAPGDPNCLSRETRRGGPLPEGPRRALSRERHPAAHDPFRPRGDARRQGPRARGHRGGHPRPRPRREGWPPGGLVAVPARGHASRERRALPLRPDREPRPRPRHLREPGRQGATRSCATSSCPRGSTRPRSW